MTHPISFSLVKPLGPGCVLVGLLLAFPTLAMAQISQSGNVLVDGAPGDVATAVDPNSIEVGDTAIGMLTVNGGGLVTVGLDNQIEAGSGSDGDGTITFENGAAIETLWLESGSNGTGLIVITGATTLVEIDPDNGGFSPPFDFEAGFMRAGRNNGSDGRIEINGGATVIVSEGATATLDAGLQIARNAGSIGEVVVSGADTLLDIATSGIPDFIDTFGPFLTMRSGEGSLRVEENAVVQVSGFSADFVVGQCNVDADSPNGCDAATHSVEIVSGGQVRVSGDGAVANLGVRDTANVEALISGASSTLLLEGTDNGLFVSRDGTVELTIENGGAAEAHFLEIGGNRRTTDDTAEGRVDLSGADSRINLKDVGSGGDGPFFTVGRCDGGKGSMTISQGAKVTFEDIGSFPGFQLARTSGAEGRLSMFGAGTEIAIVGDQPFVRVARATARSACLEPAETNTAVGRMAVTGGAIVTLDDPGSSRATFGVGEENGADGELIVSSEGSLVDGGNLMCVGLDHTFSAFDTPDGCFENGAAKGEVVASDGGVVQADVIAIGQVGELKGDGTFGGDIFNRGGEVAPGTSLGTMAIQGNFTQQFGELEIEIGGTDPGRFDVLAVSGAAELSGGEIVFAFVDGFVPAAGDSFAFLTSPALSLFPAVTTSIEGLAPGLAFEVVQDGDSLVLEVQGNGVPAPLSALVAAALPFSRSVPVGVAATYFATMINATGADASNCMIEPETSLPASFSFQTTMPDGSLTGSPDTAVDIPSGDLQTFVMSFTPAAPFSPTEVEIAYRCDGIQADVFKGVNTVFLAAEEGAVPDIVALVATLGGNGIVDIAGPTGAGAFAVAVSNVGAGGDFTVRGDTGGVDLPLSILVCETDVGGACLADPAAEVATTIGAAETASFAFFVIASDSVAFVPQRNRVYARFLDVDDVVRGATSVAARTVAAAMAAAAN